MALRKILVVDDDAPTRSLLKALLEHTGFACVQAATGREALEFLGTPEYEVVVLDLLLPDLDGFEVLRHMKQSSNALVPRTSVLTAAAERLYDKRHDLDGIWCVLAKPVDIGELNEHIEDCAAQQRRERKGPLRIGPHGSDSQRQVS